MKLCNCNSCQFQPKTSWNYMNNLAKEYLIPEIEFDFRKSMFAIKPILVSSENDDSRPTVIKEFFKKPRFISVNTIYELEKHLL